MGVPLCERALSSDFLLLFFVCAVLLSEQRRCAWCCLKGYLMILEMETRMVGMDIFILYMVSGEEGKEGMMTKKTPRFFLLRNGEEYKLHHG